MKKIKVYNLTYFFILSAFLCGMFKECLILLFIIFMHEIGHVISIRHFNYEIISLEFLPFGGITKINKDINSSINEEIIISLSGLFMQIILYVVFSFLFYHDILDYNSYIIFNKYNFSIFIFNFLPIIPLDGSIFIKSILEKYMSFYLSFIINIIISFICLIIFTYINYVYELNNYIICFFLLYKIMENIKNYKYLKNKFLLERYLKNYNFKKTKFIKKINDFQKECYHYTQKNQLIVKEREILSRYFHS